MAKAKSEWLTSLHCSFQDQENLYLVAHIIHTDFFSKNLTRTILFKS